MIGKRTEKLTERFIGPYKIKKIVLSNTVELELLATIKIYLVVNISRIQRYNRLGRRTEKGVTSSSYN